MERCPPGCSKADPQLPERQNRRSRVRLAGRAQPALRPVGKGVLGFLEDLDWRAVAGESESAEVKATSAELETVLDNIDRTAQR
jgi:hypothetical protein